MKKKVLYEENNSKKIAMWISRNLTFIYLFIAMILILLPKTEYTPFNPEFNDILEKIGFIALTSGVFAAVLKSIQFTGLFKEELNKVISGSALLKNRKDLPELWKKISKIIYYEKFPEISETLENRILDTYFPTNLNHYNEDVNVLIVIDEITEDFVISYTQVIEYVSILNSSREPSVFNFTSTLTDEEDLEEITKLISLKVDNKEFVNEIIAEETSDNGKARYSITVPLAGQERFIIYHKMKRKYSLKGENYKLLRFNTLTKNVDVKICHPENVEVSFFGIGIIKDFDLIHTEIKNCISRRHRNDLILPKQGFGLSFNRR